MDKLIRGKEDILFEGYQLEQRLGTATAEVPAYLQRRGKWERVSFHFLTFFNRR
jgi:hypothetical protein